MLSESSIHLHKIESLQLSQQKLLNGLAVTGRDGALPTPCVCVCVSYTCVYLDGFEATGKDKGQASGQTLPTSLALSYQFDFYSCWLTSHDPTCVSSILSHIFKTSRLTICKTPTIFNLVENLQKKPHFLCFIGDLKAEVGQKNYSLKVFIRLKTKRRLKN